MKITIEKESIIEKIRNYYMKNKIKNIYNFINKKTNLEESFKEWNYFHDQGNTEKAEELNQEKILPKLMAISRLTNLLTYKTERLIKNYLENPSKNNNMLIVSEYINTVPKLIALEKIFPPIKYSKIYQKNIESILEKSPDIQEEILELAKNIQSKIKYLDNNFILKIEE